MFRRSKSDSASSAQTPAKPGGKGRPTPTRKEAEAAAKARAKSGPRTRKERAAAQRSSRAVSGAKMREAMRTGDERHLPQRDKGPVRRFIRDFIDSRISLVEFLVPLMLISLVLGWTREPGLMALGNALLLTGIAMAGVEMVMMRFRMRRELARRFPDEPLKGTTYYMVMRALQVRFLRLPKRQVKIGQKLPEHYS